MLGTIIVSGHMDIKTLYTRTEKRAEDRNLRGSGLRRAVSFINGLFSGLLGRRRPMRGPWVRRRGFLFLACCTDFRRGSWSMSSSSDSSRRLRRVGKNSYSKEEKERKSTWDFFWGKTISFLGREILKEVLALWEDVKKNSEDEENSLFIIPKGKRWKEKEVMIGGKNDDRDHEGSERNSKGKLGVKKRDTCAGWDWSKSNLVH